MTPDQDEDEIGAAPPPSILGTVAAFGNGSSVTTHNVTLPSGISAGERLLVIFSTGGDAMPSAVPSGWERVGQDRNGTLGSSRSITIFTRIADGSEGSTLPVTVATAQQASALSCRLRGAKSVQAAFSTGSSTSPNPPSLTPTQPVRRRLWLAAAAVRSSSNPSAIPTDYSSANYASNNGGNLRTAAASRTVLASSQDPSAFTIAASDSWACATIAIQPFG